MLEATTDKPAESSPSGEGSTTPSALGSMEKAAAAASSAVDTAQPGGPSQTTATSDATGQPIVQGQPGAPGTRGEAPESRIEAAVKNARAEVQAQFAWATPELTQLVKDVSPADLKVSLELLRDLRRDPRAFHAVLTNDLKGLPGGEPEKEEALPQPALVAEDGKTRAYSAEQVMQIAAGIEKRVLASVNGQLKPIQDRYQSEEQRSQAEARQRQGLETAKTVLTEARELPHFTENEPKIREKFLSLPEAERKANPVAAMYKAYSLVLKEGVFPGIETAAEKRVREGFDKKVHTSRGSASPAGSSGDAGTPKLNSVDDLAAHMRRMEEVGVPA